LAVSASTSSSVGIDGAVPGRVTEIPATAQTKRTACSGSTLSDLFTRFVGTSVEKGSDFLPFDAVIAVLVDSVEYPLDEILNLGLRKRTIAVGVHYGEHHSHPCAMHHPASHSAPVRRTPSEIAMPTVASSFCARAAMLLHSLLQHLSHHLTHHFAHGVFGWPAHCWRRL
jgi:hypothetical protein